MRGGDASAGGRVSLREHSGAVAGGHLHAESHVRTLTLGLAAGLFLFATSCDRHPSGPVSHVTINNVEVARVDDGIRLTNGTDEPLAYAVWANGFLGLFAPCTDPGPDCVRLAAGATVVVPFDQVTGIFPDETTAIVRWWRVVPDGEGGYRAVGLREVTIAL